jgi:hypothetical protein
MECNTTQSSGKKKCWETSRIGSDLALAAYAFTIGQEEEEKGMSCGSKTEELDKN